MEACVVICRSKKPKDRRGKVLFIDAVNEIARERTQNFLRADHQQRIANAYLQFSEIPEFAAIVDVRHVLANGAKLSIPLYVDRSAATADASIKGSISAQWATFDSQRRDFWLRMDVVSEMADRVAREGGCE